MYHWCKLRAKNKRRRIIAIKYRCYKLNHFTSYILEERRRATCCEYRCSIDQYTVQTRFAVAHIGAEEFHFYECFFLEF